MARAVARKGTRAAQKVLTWAALRRRLAALRREGKRIVFTNGCFEIIHPGHVRYLRAAKALGDVLVVAVNTDASVRRLGKGAGRPVVADRDRAEVVAALEMVDYVILFDQDTPLEAVRYFLPDVLVKGGDWPPDRIVGGDVVRRHGGIVRAVPYVQGYSTSELIRRLRDLTDRVEEPTS